MMTHNVKIINYIYIKLYLLLYHLILPIRHGGPFVAIFRDDEAIAVPGWEDFLFAGDVEICYGDMAAVTSVSCGARHIGPAGEESRIIERRPFQSGNG